MHPLPLTPLSRGPLYPARHAPGLMLTVVVLVNLGLSVSFYYVGTNIESASTRSVPARPGGAICPSVVSWGGVAVSNIRGAAPAEGVAISWAHGGQPIAHWGCACSET